MGDGVLFYHSSADPAGIVGIAKVARPGYPDPSQFDPKSKYYDPDSPKENPRWYSVDVAFERKFNEMISLGKLRKTKGLEKMGVLRKGNRLSVQPVTEREWKIICSVAID